MLKVSNVFVIKSTETVRRTLEIEQTADVLTSERQIISRVQISLR